MKNRDEIEGMTTESQCHLDLAGAMQQGTVLCSHFYANQIIHTFSSTTNPKNYSIIDPCIHYYCIIKQLVADTVQTGILQNQQYSHPGAHRYRSGPAHPIKNP